MSRRNRVRRPSQMRVYTNTQTPAPELHEFRFTFPTFCGGQSMTLEAQSLPQALENFAKLAKTIGVPYLLNGTYSFSVNQDGRQIMSA